MKKIGTINGTIVCNLMDANNNVLGTTIDTPNAVAYAMAINENVVKSVAHYEMFGDTIRTREELADRFSGAVYDKVIHEKNLKWNKVF